MSGSVLAARGSLLRLTDLKIRVRDCDGWRESKLANIFRNIRLHGTHLESYLCWAQMSLLKRYLALSKLQVVSRKVVRGTKEKNDASAPGSQERFKESLR